jgi:dUTP pyrophosphatase
MEIKYKKLVPEAKAPIRKFEVDAGFDLYSISRIETPDYIEYKTGIAFEIPEDYVGLLFPRSSVTNYDLMLKNSVGVIDASYRGEIVGRFRKIIGDKVKDILLNENDISINFDNAKIFDADERVMQIVFIEIPKITLIEVEELSETQRGSGGFGHTGNK